MRRATESEAHWRTLGRCSWSDVDPEDWFPVDGIRTAANARAEHLCRAHCPVRERCRADGEALPAAQRHSVIIGGVAYSCRGEPMKRHHKAPPANCADCANN